MGPERFLHKQIEFFESVIPLTDYITILSKYTNDGNRLTLIDATVEECFEKFIKEEPYSRNYCLFSNEVGHALVTNNLTREAAVAYQFAFDREDPYFLNTIIYARNLIDKAYFYLTSLGGQLTEHDKLWLKTSTLSVLRAKNCLKHAQEDYWNKQGCDNFLNVNGGLTDAEHFTWEQSRAENWGLASQAEAKANNIFLIAQSLNLS